MLSAIYQQHNTGKVKGNLEQIFTTALPGPSFPWQLGLAITAWADTLCGWTVLPKLLLSYQKPDVQQGHAGSKATFPCQSFLSPSGCRYSPHKDADPLKPREPAIIEGFIAYKNQDHGAWLRGGDVWLDNCQWVLPYFNPQSSAWCLWQA